MLYHVLFGTQTAHIWIQVARSMNLLVLCKYGKQNWLAAFHIDVLTDALVVPAALYADFWLITW